MGAGLPRVARRGEAGGRPRSVAEDPVPALLGQPEGRLLRVAGRQPLRPLLQERRPAPEDDLLNLSGTVSPNVARARRYAALATAALALGLLSSAAFGAVRTTAPG